MSELEMRPTHVIASARLLRCCFRQVARTNRDVADKEALNEPTRPIPGQVVLEWVVSFLPVT